MDHPPLIELKHVTKRYGTRDRSALVVADCSLQLGAGQLTVVIGPSGCGKSSLVKLIAGFEQPTGGTVWFDGKPVTGPHKDRLVLFQESALFPWMTTQANVLYGPDARGETRIAARSAADALMVRVGLQSFRDKYPQQLSGGMQRRAELARALINQPKLMILDEPFRGLDAMTKALMLDYCSTLFQETQGTVLFVTTDIDEAIFLADRLVIMTNSPMAVREVIDVDLARPRSRAGMVSDDRANAIKRRALALLHEEAMRSFQNGQKSSADFVAAYAKRNP